jgi:hypothetical protein
MDKKIARKIFNIIRNHLDFTKNLKITIRLKEGVPVDPTFTHYVEYLYDKKNQLTHYRLTSYYDYFKYREDDEYEKSREVRFKTFLENLGLERNEYTEFTLFLLHEFGHIYYEVFTLENDMHFKFRLLQRNAINNLSLAFDDKEFDKYLEKGINTAYMFNFIEPLCDNFAFQHFVPVWRKIEPLLEKSKVNKIN